MQWWVWLIVVLVLVALAVAAVAFVQARRRRGGVVVDPAGAAGPGRKDGKP